MQFFFHLTFYKNMVRFDSAVALLLLLFVSAKKDMGKNNDKQQQRIYNFEQEEVVRKIPSRAKGG